jgi:hypothetical protein
MVMPPLNPLAIGLERMATRWLAVAQPLEDPL